MKFRVIPEEEIGSTLDEHLRAMLCICFPDAHGVFARTRAWHGSAPSWTVIAKDHPDAVCGHLGVVDRFIQVGKTSLRVAGVQNVCVLPSRRGERVAARMLEVAADLMSDCGFDAGLLFCTTALTPVYAECGWRIIEHASVIRTDEHGRAARLPEGSIPMWMPVQTAAWPAGDIHLCGNDW